MADLTIDVVRRPLSVDGIYKEQGLLRIVTADGHQGNCFIGEFWDEALPHFKPILEVIKPGLIGRDVSDREWLWTYHKQQATQFRLTTRSWAPVDVALWDLAGKIVGQPIYRLLGAERTRIPSYASYPVEHTSPEGYVEEAQLTMAKGFSAYKIHPGALTTQEVARMVELVRSEVPTTTHLMLDPDCGYDVRKAMNVGRVLDAHGFHWFEDPVPYYDFDALTALTRVLATPLSVSDQSPDQFFASTQFIKSGVLLPRGTSARLGITGLRKLCAAAEAFGLNCEVGTAGNPLLNAANLHVLLSVSNSDFFEYLYPEETERFGLTAYLEPGADGTVTVPDQPGLGFTLDEEWIAHHTVATLSG